MTAGRVCRASRGRSVGRSARLYIASVRNAVAAQVRAAIRRDAVPGGTILLSRLHEAISIAEGEEDHVIHSPTVNVTPETGHIVTPGNIEWVS